MRICQYTTTALPMIGGQEMVVDALARQFAGVGHDVVVLAPQPRRPLKAQDAHFPYAVVRHPRFISTRHLVSFYRYWLLKLHRQRPFDVLHCHGTYPAGYLAALCRERLHVPVLITSHGEDAYEGNARLAKPLLRSRHVQALAAADALVAISRFTEEGFRRLHATDRQIVRIPNGVDPDAYASPALRPEGLDPAIQSGRYFLFLGRLHRRKGVDVLLNALALIPDNGLVQLVVAGGGGEQGTLEAQAGSLGIAHRLRFVGSVSGTTKVYLLQNALCSVVPSRDWEAFGLVVLESYAAGCPVVASRITGLRDLIEPGQTGLLVPPESPRELAEALVQVTTDPAQTRALGEQGRRFAQNYSWQAIAQRHLRLYDQLLGQPSTSKAAADKRTIPRSGRVAHEQRLVANAKPAP